jgi:hypothetical protein
MKILKKRMKYCWLLNLLMKKNRMCFHINKRNEKLRIE